MRGPPRAKACQLLADDVSIVELDRGVPDLLDRLVTLAGDDNDVPGAADPSAAGDRPSPVRLDQQPGGPVAARLRPRR